MITVTMSTLVSTHAFLLTHNVGDDGVAQIMMIGELDIAVADQVSTSLIQCLGDGAPLRLDLSLLTFIDSSGLQALIAVVTEGRAAGADVEIDRPPGQQARRVIDLAGLGPVLWPEHPPSAPARP